MNKIRFLDLMATLLLAGGCATSETLRLGERRLIIPAPLPPTLERRHIVLINLGRLRRIEILQDLQAGGRHSNPWKDGP